MQKRAIGVLRGLGTRLCAAYKSAPFRKICPFLRTHPNCLLHVFEIQKIMASLERQYFWGKILLLSTAKYTLFVTLSCYLGCTLSKDKPEFKWLSTEDQERIGEVDLLNQLALSQVRKY